VIFSLRTLTIVLIVVVLASALTLGYLFWDKFIPPYVEETPASSVFSDQEKQALLDQFSNDTSGLSVEEKSNLLVDSADAGLSEEAKMQLLTQ